MSTEDQNSKKEKPMGCPDVAMEASTQEEQEIEEAIPSCPDGEELWERFQWTIYNKDPSRAPVAKALVDAGYTVNTVSTEPEQAVCPMMGSEIYLRGLRIEFRQPTAEDLMVVFLERGEKERMGGHSPLWGLVQFFQLCRKLCPEVDQVGGWVSKLQERPEDHLTGERLIDFYTRVLGDVCMHQHLDELWVFGHLGNSTRWKTHRIWRGRA